MTRSRWGLLIEKNDDTFEVILGGAGKAQAKRAAEALLAERTEIDRIVVYPSATVIDDQPRPRLAHTEAITRDGGWLDITQAVRGQLR